MPIILLIFGILVIAGVFIVSRKRVSVEVETQEASLLDLPLSDRPVVSLTPTSDGHYLKLRVEKIRFPAKSFDYELLYKTGNGITQGVPGTADLGGKEVFETELLLGSESSGKFRYDEGVEEGTLLLSFRDGEGKLLVKFSSDFHLESNVEKITSLDQKLECSFSDGRRRKHFYLTMQTIGIPVLFDKEVKIGPYGIFSSFDGEDSAIVVLEQFDTYRLGKGDDSWEPVEPDKRYNCQGFYIGSQK